MNRGDFGRIYKFFMKYFIFVQTVSGQFHGFQAKPILEDTSHTRILSIDTPQNSNH
jgi:hypothetical protein